MIKKRLLIFGLILIVLSVVSFLLIQFTKGYRPDFGKKTLRPTGLLVATSTPDGAQIFLDGKLKSATNNTLSLSPDTYEVEIKKDGFSTWKKTLEIKKEVVIKTDAYLFPLVPDLRALTFTGALNPSLSPDGTRLVYIVQDNQTTKDGLWVLDLSDLPFGRTREPRQVIQSTLRTRDFAKAAYFWSPDSKQILVTLGKENFLVDPNSTLTLASSLINISGNVPIILRQWQEEEDKRQELRLKRLPLPMLEAIKNVTGEIIFSPDEIKILYTATASASLGDVYVPNLPAASTQKQERNLKPNQMYIYDIKEDRNFWLMAVDEKIKVTWFPTSRHILLVEQGKVEIKEYDGTNGTKVYDGPFEDQLAFPWPDGGQILILTSLSNDKEAVSNLYSVRLR